MSSSSSVRRNANGGLAAAMVLLIQNHAAYVSDQRETQKEFARIRRELEEIKAILVRHERMLAECAAAIADLPRRIGFKSS